VRTAPLVSVHNRIAEASAALERLMTEPFVPDEPDELGWRMTPELHRFRLLWWLDDLRREETICLTRRRTRSN
jgi:hypothetical protein